MMEAIVAYLDMHPQAMDTCDGIAQWWLVGKQIHVDLPTLRKVLKQLTEDDVLETVGPATTPVFVGEANGVMRVYVNEARASKTLT